MKNEIETLELHEISIAGLIRESADTRRALGEVTRLVTEQLNQLKAEVTALRDVLQVLYPPEVLIPAIEIVLDKHDDDDDQADELPRQYKGTWAWEEVSE